MKVSIIGGGVMGSAIANALIKSQTLSAKNLTISDPDLGKLQALQTQGTSILSDNLKAIQNSEIILLAIKPQLFTAVLAPLQNKIPKNALVISIAAGVSIQKIQTLLNHSKITRVMPNTPALIGKGFSGWVNDSTISKIDKEKIKTILNSFGTEAELTSEDQLDAITALSGSGPAYVFLFLQSLIAGGIKLGLSEEIAKKAALQTVLGGVNLAQNSNQDLQTLIENVTSKGGTTAAARAKFDELNFKENITEAMQSAYNRSKELSNN